jgi:hypothetical protein
MTGAITAHGKEAQVRHIGRSVFVLGAAFAAAMFISGVAWTQDADGDLMPDPYENSHACLMANTVDGSVDYDADGLTSLAEYQYSPSLDPCRADTDHDFLPDGWEHQYPGCGLNPLSLDSERAFVKLGSDQRLTSAPGYSQMCSLAWTGSGFGMSWYDNRDGNDEIYFALVSAAGAKVGPDYRVTSDENDSIRPSLVWTGSQYGVSWYDNRNGNYEIYFARQTVGGAKLGTDLQVTNDAGYSTRPSLAWTGSGFGISWEDNRDGNYEIYFARVSAAGVKLGPDLRVSGEAANSFRPSLAWTGSEFGVSWQDLRDGNYEIYFQRVSAAGVKLGAELRLTGNTAYSYLPSLVWAGSEFGVSWYDYRDGNDEIYFMRVSAAGAKIGADYRVTSAAGISAVPSLVWDGLEFGVSWYDNRDGNNEIYFARISAAGTKLGADFRVTNDAGGSYTTCLAWTGSEFGVGWFDDRDGNYEIYFTRLGGGAYTDKDGDNLAEDAEYRAGTNPCATDSDGDGIDDGVEITTYQTNPAVPDSDSDGLSDGAEINTHHTDARHHDTDHDGLGDGAEVNVWLTAPLVADTDGDAMRDGFEADHQVCAGLNPLLPGNTALDPDSDGLSNLAEFNAGADPCREDTDADALPDGWEDQYRGCGFDPTSLGSERPFVKLGSDQRLTSATGNSERSSLAWTGSEYGVSWVDTRNGSYEIFFARASVAGAKLDADLRVTTTYSTRPSLAWTGSEFGLSWTDDRDGNDEIYFARISAAGVKAGPDLRLTSNPHGSNTSSLVWTGSEFGVSWEDSPDGHVGIYFARVSAAGAKIGSDLWVFSGGSSFSSLAWTGSEFGVSWTDNNDGNYEIYFARISAAGGKLDEALRVTSDAADSFLPSLAWTGSEFGVGWYDSRDGDPEVYFARVSAAGEKIGSDLRVTGNASASYLFALSWTGSEFGASWEDWRDGNYEIYFARISAAGAKLGADLRVTGDASASFMPCLAWTGSEFGVSWNDGRDGGGYEIYFARIGGGPYTDKDRDDLAENGEYSQATNPCLWDTEGDRLPDGYEAANLAHEGGVLDPLNAFDAAADYDGDGNRNANEYWNGSDPWTIDPTPGQYENPGCYFWADADGDGNPAPSDLVLLKLQIAGVAQEYRDILPHGIDTLDLDRDGNAAPSDQIMLKLIVALSEQPGGYPSQALALEAVDTPTGSVAVGSTTHVTVSVHSVSGAPAFAPGFGVVFEVSGNAVLLGGDGTANGEAVGNRYDFSMEAAAGARANVVVLVTGPGAISIGAKVPECGAYPNGRWNDEVLLNSPVVINSP